MTSVSSVSGGLSAADYLNEPYAIKHGDSAAKSAYSEALGFEQVFVNELSQQLTATLGGDSSDSSDSSDSVDGSSDGSSSSPAGPYSSLLSSALSQGVMSSGGAGGLAMQLTQSLDPSLALHTK
jgi:Rod binding domain-containing protein